jgi:hypothetical protein
VKPRPNSWNDLDAQEVSTSTRLQDSQAWYEQQLAEATKELSERVGMQGSLGQVSAGGVQISSGLGLGAYEGGILKSTIEPDGDVFIGSNIEQHSGVSFAVFVNTQAYNAEEMQEGDILIGNNSDSVSNMKWDASEGQFQFRFGTTVTAYMDTDGTLKFLAGEIGGWVIGPDSIKDAAGVVGMLSTVTGGDDIRFFAGHATPASAPFRVTEAGALVASNATITGSITATSGSIAGWQISDTRIQKYTGLIGIALDSDVPQIRVGDTGGTYIIINGDALTPGISSSNYDAGVSGFNIDADTGDAEFNNLTARGELRTFLLTSSNQMAVAGNIIVSKDAGKLGADVSSGATTVNFGKALTVGDWIKIQGPDDAGSNNLEWMLIGSLVSGTTYNVTRNVDGSGANGWLKDTPFVVIGASGDSRIELVAGSSGSIQLITQGATWNTQTVQASMSTVAGAITAGGGSVNIDSTGITTDNNYPGVSFLATNPLKTAYLKMSSTDDFAIRNSVAGKKISLTIDLADASTPAVQWSEDGNNANVSLLTVNASPTAPARLTIGGIAAANVGIDLWANKDGKATVFNDNSYDIDFRIEGSTEANMFFIDAGNNRVGIGTGSPSAAFNAEGGAVFNDFGADVDHRIEGDTDPNLQVWDAGLDAIGMGGAAESGYKLKVTGDEKVTGKIVADAIEVANGSATLGSTFSITGTAGTYQDTGLSVTLPSAGSYRITANVRGVLQGNAGTLWWITAKLYNSTDAADVTDSERIVTLTGTTGLNLQNTAPIVTRVTVAASKTIKLYAFRNGDGSPSWTQSNIGSDANGRTTLMYEKE